MFFFFRSLFQKTPDHVQNTATGQTWRQLTNETICAINGHLDHVPDRGACPGLPQSHCYRCGKANRYASATGPEWVKPLGDT